MAGGREREGRGGLAGARDLFRAEGTLCGMAATCPDVFARTPRAIHLYEGSI